MNKKKLKPVKPIWNSTVPLFYFDYIFENKIEKIRKDRKEKIKRLFK